MNRQLDRITGFAVVLLGLLLIGLQPVLGSTVGPVYLSDGVTVFSPVDTTYNTKNILFNYTVAVGMGMHISLNYTLDGSLTGALPYTVINPNELHVFYLARGQVQLSELSEGQHTLTISFYTDFNFYKNVNSYVDTIHFIVDLSASDVVLDATPPNIIIQTPQTNQTYSGTVPLNVLLNEPTTPFTVTIDGNRTITLPAQNTTLTDLTIGTHSLSIKANDLVGNQGYSNRVSFYLTLPTPTPMPTAPPTESTKPPQQPIDNRFPAVLVTGAVIASLALAFLAVKKRTHGNLLRE
jgi:hypothetical protein